MSQAKLLTSENRDSINVKVYLSLLYLPSFVLRIHYFPARLQVFYKNSSSQVQFFCQQAYLRLLKFVYQITIKMVILLTHNFIIITQICTQSISLLFIKLNTDRKQLNCNPSILLFCLIFNISKHYKQVYYQYSTNMLPRTNPNHYGLNPSQRANSHPLSSTDNKISYNFASMPPHSKLYNNPNTFGTHSPNLPNHTIYTPENNQKASTMLKFDGDNVHKKNSGVNVHQFKPKQQQTKTQSNSYLNLAIGQKNDKRTEFCQPNIIQKKIKTAQKVSMVKSLKPRPTNFQMIPSNKSESFYDFLYKFIGILSSHTRVNQRLALRRLQRHGNSVKRAIIFSEKISKIVINHLNNAYIKMKVIKRQSDSKNNGLRQETSLRSDSGTNSAKKMNELLNNQSVQIYMQQSKVQKGLKYLADRSALRKTNQQQAMKLMSQCISESNTMPANFRQNPQKYQSGIQTQNGHRQGQQNNRENYNQNGKQKSSSRRSQSGANINRIPTKENINYKAINREQLNLGKQSIINKLASWVILSLHQQAYESANRKQLFQRFQSSERKYYLNPNALVEACPDTCESLGINSIYANFAINIQDEQLCDENSFAVQNQDTNQHQNTLPLFEPTNNENANRYWQPVNRMRQNYKLIHTANDRQNLNVLSYRKDGEQKIENILHQSQFQTSPSFNQKNRKFYETKNQKSDQIQKMGSHQKSNAKINYVNTYLNANTNTNTNSHYTTASNLVNPNFNNNFNNLKQNRKNPQQASPSGRAPADLFCSKQNEQSRKQKLKSKQNSFKISELDCSIQEKQQQFVQKSNYQNQFIHKIQEYYTDHNVFSQKNKNRSKLKNARASYDFPSQNIKINRLRGQLKNSVRPKSLSHSHTLLPGLQNNQRSTKQVYINKHHNRVLDKQDRLKSKTQYYSLPKQASSAKNAEAGKEYLFKNTNKPVTRFSYNHGQVLRQPNLQVMQHNQNRAIINQINNQIPYQVLANSNSMPKLNTNVNRIQIRQHPSLVLGNRQQYMISSTQSHQSSFHYQVPNHLPNAQIKSQVKRSQPSFNYYGLTSPRQPETKQLQHKTNSFLKNQPYLNHYYDSKRNSNPMQIYRTDSRQNQRHGPFHEKSVRKGIQLSNSKGLLKNCNSDQNISNFVGQNLIKAQLQPNNAYCQHKFRSPNTGYHQNGLS